MGWKIICSVLTVCFFINFNAEAQKHPQLRYLSADAGFNISGIRSAFHYDKHVKNFGANISIAGNYSFSDFKSAGVALSFEQKGASDNVHDVNTNLNYLSLPVYFKWAAGKDPVIFFTTGVYAGWLINANKRGELFVDGKTNRVSENITSGFRSLDGGLIIGTGIMVRLYDDFDFMITVRGSLGLLKIENFPGHNPKNYHINIGLGYIYYIGFR
jgi:hypothetical protein